MDEMGSFKEELLEMVRVVNQEMKGGKFRNSETFLKFPRLQISLWPIRSESFLDKFNLFDMCKGRTPRSSHQSNCFEVSLARTFIL
jgi:hypothetical protein